MAKSTWSSGSPDIIAVFTTPIGGLEVSIDRSTLEAKALQHGQAWVNLEQCRLVFEEPVAVYESQHQDMEGVLLFYRPALITTPQVKFVRGVADFNYGSVGRIVSLHPRRAIGNTGFQLYPMLDAETGDADT